MSDKNNASLLEDDGLPGFAIRKANTEAWFEEWNAKQWLGDLLAMEGPEDRSEIAPHAEVAEPAKQVTFKKHAFDWQLETIMPGAVRLLGPDMAREDEDLCSLPYVVILGLWEPGWWLVAPFSRYEAPASIWEMLIEHEARPLQVIQAWNARTLPEAVLAQSWFVCKASDEVTHDALKLTRAALAGRASVVKELADKLGAGVTSVDDPRHAFFAGENARFAALTRAAIAWEEAVQGRANSRGEPASAQAWRRSALPLSALAVASSGQETRLRARLARVSLPKLLSSLAYLEPMESGGAEFLCELEAAIQPSEDESGRWFGVFRPLETLAEEIVEGTPFLLIREKEGLPCLAGSGNFERRRFRLKQGTPGVENLQLSDLALVCAAG
jgi:hypothetical protein